MRVLKCKVMSGKMIAKMIALKETTRKVQFTGTDLPSIPINWRFAESAAALKALGAGVIGALLKKKYGVDAPTTEINTYPPPPSTVPSKILAH
jgi:hypothetical protein